MDLGLSWRDNAIANKHIRILRNPLGDYKGFAKLWSKAKRTAKVNLIELVDGMIKVQRNIEQQSRH